MCRTSMKRVACLFAAAVAMTLVAQPVQAEIEFGIPTPLPGLINEFMTGYPSLAADDLSMHFTAIRTGSTGGSADLWITSRSSPTDMWQTPVNLGPNINTAANEMGSSMTADGLELYFERTTNIFSHDDGDLWVSRRMSVSDAWGVPERLDYLNTPGRDGDPYISLDGLELYFDSTRDPNFPIPGNLLNTYVARRASRAEPFGTPEYFYISGAPAMTNDGLTYLMTANDVVGKYDGDPTWYGAEDLYVRTRTSTNGEFGPGQNLLAPINTTGLDCCGDFSSDGSTIYFTSLRPGGPGIFNIWEAPLAEAVSLDIKPGSSRNPINLKSKGVLLPVAILSTEEFDATQVDLDTLLFGDPLLIADGKSPVSPLRGNYEDVNYDGLTDLTLKFSMRELLENEVIGAATVQGYLAGQLVDGTEIAGRDMVVIVPAARGIPEPSSLLLILVAALALRICKRM